MKKMIAVALLLVGMTGFAQEKISMEDKKSKRVAMEQMTPEQKNQLHLKKLTLELDLSASQQKEMATIIAEQQTKREAQKAQFIAQKKADKKLTSDEIFVMKNKKLDEQIAMKERVKKILSPEQFEKWEKMKKTGVKKGMKKHFNKKTSEEKIKK
ncbi:hypothetical protein [Flavobacterium soli]|uniref:hypothetical protein n=1 Tax=Flavobacterium soli TaxID=344881 RepID=UPI0012FA3FB6|nr:hypothetical protein [Flavobacterium soli]